MGKTPEELRAAFWEEDREKGCIIRSQYDEIKRVLKEQDMEWVNQQLRKIKEHAIAQTDFYRDFSPDDQFPVVNKMILTERKEEFSAKGGFLTPIHISSTSGSTGTPFSVAQDYKKRNRTIADLKVFGELADYPSHERMLFFRALSAKLNRTAEQEDRENIYYIDSSELSPQRLSQMADAIVKYKPRTIFSYASTLVELGKYLANANISTDKIHLHSVLTAGEGISEEDRRMLERAFGCKVFRRYSDMELGILGQDSGDGKNYSLNWGSYYFECLKLDEDEPTESGEVGRIVITDLFNYAFPMIRYDTGDLGIMSYCEGGQFPTYKEIYGRKRDCIYTTEGALFSPAKISVTMWGVPNVKQWQFIQEGKQNYVLKLNCENDMDCSGIVKRFKDLLGENAEIAVQRVDDIPVLASNKRRAVICNYHPEIK